MLDTMGDMDNIARHEMLSRKQYYSQRSLGIDFFDETRLDRHRLRILEDRLSFLLCLIEEA